jgi:hypothetical protein
MATNATDEVKDGAIQTIGSQDPEAPSPEVSGKRQSLSDKFTIVSPSSSDSSNRHSASFPQTNANLHSSHLVQLSSPMDISTIS